MRFTNINHLVKSAVASTLMVFACGSSAALITGDITFSGDWDSDTTVEQTTAMTFPGNDVDTDDTNGDFSSIIAGQIGTITSLDFGVNGPNPGSFLSIGGFDINLTQATVVFQTTFAILVEGSGIASGNGFDATAVEFYFSANQNGPLRNFSAGFTAQPVPVPGALILFASALAGLGLRRT